MLNFLLYKCTKNKRTYFQVNFSDWKLMLTTIMFEEFMAIVFKEFNIGYLDFALISRYLFVNMNYASIVETYGQREKAYDKFCDRLMLSINLGDFEIVNEIWSNFEAHVKHLWVVHTDLISELPLFFVCDPAIRKCHNFFKENNLSTFCCDYCWFLKSINVCFVDKPLQ